MSDDMYVKTTKGELMSWIADGDFEWHVVSDQVPGQIIVKFNFSEEPYAKWRTAGSRRRGDTDYEEV